MYWVRKLLQICGHRFDSGVRCHTKVLATNVVVVSVLSPFSFAQTLQALVTSNLTKK